MGLLNYTTKIDPDKTAAEIAPACPCTGRKPFSPNTTPTAATCRRCRSRSSSTASRWASHQREKNRRIDPSREQAVRTAWRIVKDWVEAQMALVETQMVSTQDVFLPYAVMQDGRTLAERVRESPQFLLGGGS